MQAILTIFAAFAAFIVFVSAPSKFNLLIKNKANEVVQENGDFGIGAIKQTEDFQKNFRDSGIVVVAPGKDVSRIEVVAVEVTDQRGTRVQTQAQTQASDPEVLEEQGLAAPVSDIGSAEIMSLINAYKPIFAANKEKAPPAGEDAHVLRLGSGRVLITAPHAVNHIRNGSAKIVDYCTGPIAKALSDLTGAHLLYLNYYSRDPNYYDDTSFKEVLANFVPDNDIKLVVDIHGAADSHGWDVDLGDINGASLIRFKDLASVVTEFFRQYGINNISRNDFSGGGGQDTVTKFVSLHLNVDAMQFEIARKYRCETDERTVAAVRALKKIVEEYK